MLQLPNGLRLHFSDTLARDLEDAIDLLECVGVSVADAIAELDQLAIMVGQRFEHLLDLLPEDVLSGLGSRIDSFRSTAFSRISS